MSDNEHPSDRNDAVEVFPFSMDAEQGLMDFRPKHVEKEFPKAKSEPSSSQPSSSREPAANGRIEPPAETTTEASSSPDVAKEPSPTVPDGSASVSAPSVPRAPRTAK